MIKLPHLKVKPPNLHFLKNLKKVKVKKPAKKSISKIPAFFTGHLPLFIILVMLIGFIFASLKLRSYLISKITTPQPTPTLTADNSPEPAPSDATQSATASDQATPSPSDTSVLGASTTTYSYVPPTLPPAPTINPTPVPTYTPTPTSNPAPVNNPTPTPTPSSPAPDAGHSSLSAGSAPADGSSQATVNITLNDSNGNPIAFYTVSLSSSDGGFHYGVINSSITGGGGNISLAAYHDVYTGAGNITDSINVTATDSHGHATTLFGLGNVTFTSLGTPAPSPTASSAPSSSPSPAPSSSP